MAKPRMYGLPRIKPLQNHDQMERYWQRKQKQQRQRESTTPKAVAAQNIKPNPAKAVTAPPLPTKHGWG